jgi:AAA+ ATPase superfamily predicted ATPase
MPAKKIHTPHSFIGRKEELKTLEAIGNSKTASLLIVYGRRRVGKTELIEHAYSKRNLLKFEGIEGYSQDKQQKIVMQQLAEYAQEPLLRDVSVKNWIDVFKYLHQYTQKGKWTLYFEEVQWLSNYEDDFVSELKYAWDNWFRHNPGMVVVLCGSATSFMINKVVHSKALYNRSQHEIKLNEFSLHEVEQFFKNQPLKNMMDAFLSVGGIPEYLNRVKKNSSIYLSLCEQSFKPNSFFSKEYERIFISNFASNKHYKQIIQFLSQRKFATREEILQHLKITSGGRISELLEDLELCGFITAYTPYYATGDSKLVRFCIQDAYLQFYYKFIQPIEQDIQHGVFTEHPERAINDQALQKWLGFSFERFCRRYHHSIAKQLGFSAVRYRSGSYFSRSTAKGEPGFQIDLLFDRDDNVVTVCEIKYLRSKVPSKIIHDTDKKLALLPNNKKKRLEKVLICTYGAEKSLLHSGFFDRILTLEDLFNR